MHSETADNLGSVGPTLALLIRTSFDVRERYNNCLGDSKWEAWKDRRTAAKYRSYLWYVGGALMKEGSDDWEAGKKSEETGKGKEREFGGESRAT